MILLTTNLRVTNLQKHNSAKLNQNEPKWFKMVQNYDLLTTRGLTTLRLLIRQRLKALHKFKSCTLRIATFSDEKSVTTSNKNPFGMVHLGFFVLVGYHSADFLQFGSVFGSVFGSIAPNSIFGVHRFVLKVGNSLDNNHKKRNEYETKKTPTQTVQR